MIQFRSGARAFWLAVIGVFTLCLVFGSVAHAEDLFTQEQLDEAVASERKKWDVSEDGKITLEEAIRALQVVAGLQEDVSYPSMTIGAITVSGIGKDTY